MSPSQISIERYRRRAAGYDASAEFTMPLRQRTIALLALRPGDVDASGVKPKLVPEDKARYSREHVGSEYIGWLHFQPVYERLVQTQPDMFD